MRTGSQQHVRVLDHELSVEPVAHHPGGHTRAVRDGIELPLARSAAPGVTCCSSLHMEKVVLSPRSRTLAAGLAVLIAFAALALAPDAVPAAGQAVWEHLGMRRVNFRLDHDVILAASEGRFRSVRIVVAGGDLELFDVKITFGNGETFSPATRLYFKENSRSRTIDLPGAARIIRRIDFYYRSAPGGGQGRATVHVYGRR